MSIQPEDIAKLRTLSKIATHQPWHVDKYYCYIWGPQQEMVADSTLDAAATEIPDELGDPVIRARGVGGKLPIAANMNYIVAACGAVPGLLDAIERLQQDREGAYDEGFRDGFRDAQRLAAAAERIDAPNTTLTTGE